MSERMLDELRDYHKLKAFTDKIENFEYVWVNHSNIPEEYVIISKFSREYYRDCENKLQRLPSQVGMEHGSGKEEA